MNEGQGSQSMEEGLEPQQGMPWFTVSELISHLKVFMVRLESSTISFFKSPKNTRHEKK